MNLLKLLFLMDIGLVDFCGVGFVEAMDWKAGLFWLSLSEEVWMVDCGFAKACCIVENCF